MSKLFKNSYCKQLISLVIIVAAILTIISANYAHAQGPVIDNSSGTYKSGEYQLNDFVNLAKKVAEIIWAISGSIALLMFVYGGVLFLISSGSSQMVGRAKQAITGAVIGLAIVFGSYAIVYFIMINVLGVKGGTEVNPFNSGWFQGISGGTAPGEQTEASSQSGANLVVGGLLSTAKFSDIEGMDPEQFRAYLEGNGVDTSSVLYSSYADYIYKTAKGIADGSIDSSQNLYKSIPTSIKPFVTQEQIDQAWTTIQEHK